MMLQRTDSQGQLWLKPESLQPIGSFKLRGAYNKIASFTEQERQPGVISYSSGNHAQGVAYAARALGVKAVIVMPRNAPKIKVDSTAALGAEIVTVGPASSERLKKAEELAREHGYAIVPPYNDEQIIAGQGTVGPGDSGRLSGCRSRAGAGGWRRLDQWRRHRNQAERLQARR